MTTSESAAQPAGVNPYSVAANRPDNIAVTERMSFSGSGSEYFGIWIVNLLLSIITLGIYSAWAKVRRLRYFYDNTHVAGSNFEYHGNPIAILKGRIVAVVMVAAYNLSFQVSVWLGLFVVLVLAATAPWLIWKSLQFKLYNSSYRGIRFGFRGSAGQAYMTYLLYPFLAMISLYLLMPLAHQRMKDFQHSESKFGTTHFSFDADIGSFYVVYLIGFAAMVAGSVAIFVGNFAYFAMTGMSFNAENAASFTKLIFFIIVPLYIWIFMLYPIFLSLMQNLIWSNTRLGRHQFKCSLKWGKTAFIAFTNVLGIALTLGLYTPFAQVRWFKYRVESMSMQVAGNLDEFIADTGTQTSATGEGVADILDFDLSI
jgi:uncharacterized membrane protein YjgN (DUF898 family)